MQIVPRCSSKELKMIGDYWSLYIIQALSVGEKRFSQIERELNEINPTTLTARLKKLEKDKIIKRNEETLDKLSVCYTLTEKGMAILPIIKEIEKFGKKYL